jgi:hypothetical protein
MSYVVLQRQVVGAFLIFEGSWSEELKSCFPSLARASGTHPNHATPKRILGCHASDNFNLLTRPHSGVGQHAHAKLRDVDCIGVVQEHVSLRVQDKCDRDSGADTLRPAGIRLGRRFHRCCHAMAETGREQLAKGAVIGQRLGLSELLAEGGDIRQAMQKSDGQSFDGQRLTVNVARPQRTRSRNRAVAEVAVPSRGLLKDSGATWVQSRRYPTSLSTILYFQFKPSPLTFDVLYSDFYAATPSCLAVRNSLSIVTPEVGTLKQILEAFHTVRLAIGHFPH